MAKPLSGEGNAPQYTHDIHQNWLSTLDQPNRFAVEPPCDLNPWSSPNSRRLRAKPRIFTSMGAVFFLVSISVNPSTH